MTYCNADRLEAPRTVPDMTEAQMDAQEFNERKGAWRDGQAKMLADNIESLVLRFAAEHGLHGEVDKEGIKGALTDVLSDALYPFAEYADRVMGGDIV